MISSLNFSDLRLWLAAEHKKDLECLDRLERLLETRGASPAAPESPAAEVESKRTRGEIGEILRPLVLSELKKGAKTISQLTTVLELVNAEATYARVNNVLQNLKRDQQVIHDADRATYRLPVSKVVAL